MALQAVGAVESFLGNVVGQAIAEAIAAFVVFVVAIYLGGRVLVLPVADRLLDARGLDSHARRPLKKIVKVVVAFVAITVAFGLAEYGNFLQSLATIAAAATLAIGFAMQDVIKNFVAGIFIFTDRPFRIGDWIEWDRTPASSRTSPFASRASGPSTTNC
jgi:small-conductance mechanosensitive channel